MKELTLDRLARHAVEEEWIVDPDTSSMFGLSAVMNLLDDDTPAAPEEAACVVTGRFATTILSSDELRDPTRPSMIDRFSDARSALSPAHAPSFAQPCLDGWTESCDDHIAVEKYARWAVAQSDKPAVVPDRILTDDERIEVLEIVRSAFDQLLRLSVNMEADPDTNTHYERIDVYACGQPAALLRAEKVVYREIRRRYPSKADLVVLVANLVV